MIKLIQREAEKLGSLELLEIYQIVLQSIRVYVSTNVLFEAPHISD